MADDRTLPFGQHVTVLATVARVIRDRYGHTVLRDRRDLQHGHGAKVHLSKGTVPAWPGEAIPLPTDDPRAAINGADGGYELEPADDNEVRLRRIPLDPPEHGVFLGTCIRMEGIYHPVAGYDSPDGYEPGEPALFSPARRVRLYEVALPPLADHRPYRSVLVWPEDLLVAEKAGGGAS